MLSINKVKILQNSITIRDVRGAKRHNLPILWASFKILFSCVQCDIKNPDTFDSD